MATRTGEWLARVVRPRRADPATSDRELLRRYAEAGDQAAFEAVVRRHAAMTLAVCRRVLHSSQDAEDACQAVFLVLARKAGSVRWQPSAANWLYATARKVAGNARVASARRARREAAVAVPEAVGPFDRMTGAELVAALDEELDRLPPRYRGPLVLCYLEGLTRDEAAARLGVPDGTLKKQLERARRKLAAALTARGHTLGTVLLAVAATSQAGSSPPKLIASVMAAVGGSPSATAAALAQGVIVNGFASKLKLLGLAVVGVGAFGFAVASALPDAPQDDKPKSADKMERPEAATGKPAARPAERVVAGRVVGADGKPVAADLSLVWAGAEPQPLGRSKDDGTFQVTLPLTRNGYGGWLVASAPGHGPDFCPHGHDSLPQSLAPAAGVTLRLPKERPINGRLLDQQGKPVAGATVTAGGFSAYDTDASVRAHLKRWADELFLRGVPPDGDRGMYYSDGYAERNPGGRSPYTATSDRDGRFAVAGVGAGQLVALRVRGPGVADKELVTFNRDGFDPGPTNEATRQHKFKEFGGRWTLFGPDPTVVLEPEKLVRGRVTDPEWRPRAGVTVTVSRVSDQDRYRDSNRAVTGADGRYEVRGARKHPRYMAEVQPDPAAGLLPCQGFADDTPGYEPVAVDLKCAKGVVVSGTVTDAATGEPVPARVSAEVAANNPFVDKYPPFLHAGPSSSDLDRTDRQGRYRVVTIPGPVVLMAGPLKGDGDDYRPQAPDPKYPGLFHPTEGALMFDHHSGGQGFVQGVWCRVVDAKPTDAAVTVDIRLEPATKTSVKVVDAAGKPVARVRATGVSRVEFANPSEFPADTLTVFNLEPKTPRFLAVVHPERKLVGTGTVTAGDAAPVVRLGAGGAVTGRALGADGKPLAELTVRVDFTRRPATEVYRSLNGGENPTTDAAGRFRLDSLFPGEEFRLTFWRGPKRFGPDFGTTPKRTVARHGDALDLGDLKLEPAANEGE